MAFGTPTDGGAAYSASGGTTVAPAYPAGIAAKDVVVLVIGQKPTTANGGTVTTPTGWTLRESITGAGGYGTTTGADVGNTNLFFYTKDVVAGTETGNLTVTVGDNNVCWGLIIRIPGGGASSFTVGSADGQRTTAPTNNTAFTTLLTNGATAPNFQSGNMAIWAMCIPTDVLNNGFFVPTISSTGATFGTAVELREPDSATGNDIGGYVAYALATAGSSTAAPTVGVTPAGTVTNVRGPIALIRIRDTTQQLTPARFDNTNSFFSATITQTTPAQDLAPARYDNTNIFYSPTVTSTGGVQTLAPALYTNTNTFFAAVVSATRTLAPNRYNNSNTFYSATIGRGAVNLSPERFDNANSFYAATITQGSGTQNILPNRYTNVSTFYSATVSQTAPDQTLAPSLYPNSNAFYTTTVTVGAANLKPDTLVNANTFYTAVLDRGPVTISPARLNNQNAFYAASASRGLRPTLFANANTFYLHSASARYALLPTRYNNQNAFFAATASIEQFLIPPLVSNQNAFYAAHVAIEQFLTAPLVTNTNTIYAVNARSNYTLAPIRIASTNVFYTPSVTVGPAFILPSLFANQNRFYKQSVLWWDNQPIAPETWDGIADTPASWDALPITGETWTELYDTETTWDSV